MIPARMIPGLLKSPNLFDVACMLVWVGLAVFNAITGNWPALAGSVMVVVVMLRVIGLSDLVRYLRDEGSSLISATALADLKRTAEFNFEQYQDAGRLLHEACESGEKLSAHVLKLETALSSAIDLLHTVPDEYAPPDHPVWGLARDAKGSEGWIYTATGQRFDDIAAMLYGQRRELGESDADFRDRLIKFIGAKPDGWIDWPGGECPVAPETIVQVRFENGDVSSESSDAVMWDWEHGDSTGYDIVAYRVVRSGEVAA